MKDQYSKHPRKSDHSQGFREKIQFYLIDSKTSLGKVIDVIIILLNIFIVGIFIVETYDISDKLYSVLYYTELIVVGVFIIEYAARFYGARTRIRHLFNPYTLIDLAAIIPTVLMPFIGPGNFGILKLFRMFRVFRVLRFLRFFETTEFFFGKISFEMLKALRLILTVFMIFFVSSGLFYLVESGANTNVSNFGDAFYFMVVTLTTVGFGDIVPVTGAGKAVTTLCIIFGFVLIPIQIALIVIGWIRISQKKAVVCEQCGLKYHDPDAVHCKACGNLIYQEYENS